MDGISTLLVVAARAPVCPQGCPGQKATYKTASPIARELIVKSSSYGHHSVNNCCAPFVRRASSLALQ
jgi:hypothetical protein